MTLKKLTVEDYQAEYFAASAKVLHGLRMLPTGETRPGPEDHVLIGTLAMRDAASLGSLLVEKGVITEFEYWQAMAMGMEAEVEDTQTAIATKFGLEKVIL